MEPIIIRYGESLTLPLDAGDVNAVSADIYIGKPGQAYVLTQNISLTDGMGTFIFDTNDTKLPLDTYYYQINVTDTNGYVEKYPSPDDTCDDCDSEFPEFVVCEALDETEVS
jgi:hypothetical protein